jgi:hypothetical protein
LSIDLAVLVPLVYFLVMVRNRGWSPITTIPVFLLSFGLALLIIPKDGHGLLDSIGLVLPFIELGLLGYVGAKAIQVIKASKQANSANGDFYDSLRTVLSEVLEVRAVANALAYEIAVIYFAFSIRPARTDPSFITYHTRSGYGAIVGAILMAACFELTAIHFLLRSWSTIAVVVHAALSLYAIIWLIGDYRAMTKRPHRIDSTGIRVRNGLRWNVEIEWTQIECVRRVRQTPKADEYVNAVPFGSPRYVIELKTSQHALGPYGIEKTASSVGLRVDDESDFEARLGSYDIEVVG